MKKILFVAAAFMAVCVMSCSNNKTNKVETVNDSIEQVIDTVNQDTISNDTIAVEIEDSI